MLTEAQKRAGLLWAAAEGRAVGDAPKPTREEKRQAQFTLSESIAAGEFPTQIAPIVRRTLQKVYVGTPQRHQEFTQRKTVQAIDTDEQYNIYTFDDQGNIPATNAGDTFIQGGLPRLLPREKYPQIGLTASGKSLRASKIGEAFGIDWEAIVKSKGTNVNFVRDAVEAFGRHASNQEEIDVAKQLVTSTGFNTTTLANSLAISGNPDLSNPQTLQSTIGAVLNRTVGGALPAYDKFVVLTSVAYAPTARQALAARRITRVPARTGAGSTAQSAQWEETLEFGADFEVIGWKWLTQIFPGLGNGWILLPVAGADDLPILTSNFLEDYEEPSFWIKDSNARNVSGGEVNVEADGDYDSDALETKVRHVHGSNLLWGEAIAYSLGTNT